MFLWSLLKKNTYSLTEEELKEQVMAQFDKLYEEKEAEIGEEKMRELERMILIRVVDNQWMDHIDAMDQLRTGIGLRATRTAGSCRCICAGGLCNV